jgi:predicted nucleic acid-binding protein
MEPLSYPLLEASAQTKIEDFLSEFTVIGLGDEVKDVAAIRLRREYQLELPDAIVTATALSLEAPLLANDIKLLRIPGLSAQKLELK